MSLCNRYQGNNRFATRLSRDFTFINDIVNGMVATLEKDAPQAYSLYNIGNGNPVKLLDFIEAIEKCLGKQAIKEMLPMQPGDVERTWGRIQRSWRGISGIGLRWELRREGVDA